MRRSEELIATWVIYCASYSEQADVSLSKLECFPLANVGKRFGALSQFYAHLKVS